MPTVRQFRHSLASWLVPAVAFVAGIVIATVLTPAPSAPDVPTFGASNAGGAPMDDLVRSELLLQRDINARFVEQLRRYETRLRDIAIAADDEGAPKAAEAMREFALETEIIIDRYDLILKKK